MEKDFFSLIRVHSTIANVFSNPLYWSNRFVLYIGPLTLELIRKQFYEDYKNVYIALKGKVWIDKLLFAIKRKYTSLVETLIKKEPADSFNQHYTAILQSIMAADSTEIFEICYHLIDTKYVIYHAAFYGALKICQWLINKGFSVDTTFEDISLLYAAAQNGFTDIVDLLIKNHAVIDNLSFKGYTPLHNACQHGFAPVAKILCQAGAVVNRVSPNGSTALYFASQNGHDECVKVLLEFGADPEIAYSFGYTALYTASQHGHLAVVKRLVLAGAKIDAATRKGASPLYMACHRGRLEIAQFLLEHGAHTERRFENGYTPLFVAVAEGRDLVVDMLCKRGANINVRSNLGKKLYDEATPSCQQVLNRYL